MESQQPRRRSFIGPVILIAVGIGFLLSNMGLVHWSIWGLLWRLWPVWLIAAGLDLVIGRRSRVGSYIVLGVTLTILAGSVVYYSVVTPVSAVASGTMDIREPLGSAKEAEVEIRAGAGKVKIYGLADGENLAEGVIRTLNGEEVQRDLALLGDKTKLVLGSHGFRSIPFSLPGGQEGLWDLGLTTKIPLSLKLGTGVGEAEIDLSTLMVTGLSVETGVGKASITLPSHGKYQVQIKSGIGQMNVTIPEGTAYRIRARQGIGSVQVDGDYTQRDGYYISNDYDGAAERVDLDIAGGIGAVNIYTRAGN